MKVIGGPSLHLKWDELRCSDGAAYPLVWRKTRAVTLAEAFEAVRAIWGQRITVRSGYRTEGYNQAVGGAAHSQHVQGLALDLAPPDGVPVQDFWEAIVHLAPQTAIRGIGYAAPSAGGYVHIDCRPGTVVTTWRY